MFVWTGGARGHREKTPALLPRDGIVGRYIAPGIKLGASVTDDHHVTRHIRGAGDGIASVPIHEGICAPPDSTRMKIQGIKVTIQRSDIESIPLNGNAAIYHPATDLPHKSQINLRFESPQ